MTYYNLSALCPDITATKECFSSFDQIGFAGWMGETILTMTFLTSFFLLSRVTGRAEAFCGASLINLFVAIIMMPLGIVDLTGSALYISALMFLISILLLWRGQ